MRASRVCLNLIIFLMLLGGIMGVIKGIGPNMTWLSFRQLLTTSGSIESEYFQTSIRVYGLSMGVLEILSAVLLLVKQEIGLRVAIVTLLINSLGCLIAIILGDLFAIGSLTSRILGLGILFRAVKINAREDT